jgi:uncharacterized pyridoxamine 5'-phosphate oxidase family protein
LNLDDRREAKVSMLEAYPNLIDAHPVDDEDTAVFYLSDVYATIEDFSGQKKEFRF